MGDKQGTFDPQSDIAHTIMGLFTQIIWWAVGVFIVVESALLYAVWRFRHKPGDGLPRQLHGNTRLEVAWTVAPAIVLATIAVPTVQTIFQTYEVPAGPNVVNVEVIGHQFWWEYRYPDLGVTTASDLHVPVGQKVVLHITSIDVVHSFWIPKMGVKRDAIPGHVNTIWFTPETTGEYFGQCAEFCGLQHANMRLRVMVQSQSDFQAWVTQAKAPPAAPSTDLQRKGMELVTTGTCAGCHTIDGTNAKGKVGPNLTHFGSRTSIGGAIMDNTTEDLEKWLTDTQEVKPGNLMTVKVPNEADRQAIIAYLQNLK